MPDLPLVISTLSVLVATVASVFAWRAVSENRQRSLARIAHLADAVHAEEAPDEQPVPMPHLLEEASASQGRSMLPVLALATAIAAVGVFSWMTQPAPRADVTRTAAPAARAGAAPLELVSLTDERGPRGELELRGAVHNPANGATLSDVTAVALLFDQQGAFVTSSRAPLEARGVARGGDATFRITVPAADGIGRYRVSFRMDDHIIPHTDRRTEP